MKIKKGDTITILAGKDVFVEKPFTKTVKEARELIQIAREKDLLLVVDYEFMHDPNINLLRRAIVGGEFGRIEEVELNYLNPLAGVLAEVIQDRFRQHASAASFAVAASKKSSPDGAVRTGGIESPPLNNPEYRQFQTRILTGEKKT